MKTIAGENGKEYSIQRTILTDASEWFKKALDERYIVGHQLTLRFPDTDTQTIDYFLYYLIRGEVPFTKPTPGYDLVSIDGELVAIRLWIFGDRHFLPKLQDEAMKHLHFFSSLRYPNMDQVKESLENSTSGSTLDFYMVEALISGLCLKAQTCATGVSGEKAQGYSIEEVTTALEGIPGVMAELLQGLARLSSIFVCKATGRPFGWLHPNIRTWEG